MTVDYPRSNHSVLSGRQSFSPLDTTLLTPLGYLLLKPICISSASIIVPNRLLGVHVLSRIISTSIPWLFWSNCLSVDGFLPGRLREVTLPLSGSYCNKKEE